MRRFLSWLVAIILFVSATVEIMAFAIDNQSLIQKNFKIAAEYITAILFEPEPTAGPPECKENCKPVAPQFADRHCEEVEPMSKRILCRLTLPKVEVPCSEQDCAVKERPGDGTPGQKRSPTKGNMAELTR